MKEYPGVVDLTSNHELDDEVEGYSGPGPKLEQANTSTNGQSSQNKHTFKPTKKAGCWKQKLLGDSSLESSENNAEGNKNGKEFTICLETQTNIKKKKVEYLTQLIEDEFRTDYLKKKVIGNKVKNIYEKFKDYEMQFDGSSSAEEDKNESESIPCTLSNEHEKENKKQNSNLKSSNLNFENHSPKNICAAPKDIYSSGKLNGTKIKIKNKEYKKTKETKSPTVMFSGPDVRNHSKIEQKLRNLMFNTKSKISIGSYTIGNGVLSLDMATKLRERGQDNFRIISDQTQMANKNLKKYCNDLVALGVPIKKNNNAKNLMHCKFMIIDDKYLVEGSMNMGEKSLKNYEHITITKNPSTITSFNIRFEEMWNNENRFSKYTNDEEIDENPDFSEKESITTPIISIDD